MAKTPRERQANHKGLYKAYSSPVARSFIAYGRLQAVATLSPIAGNRVMPFSKISDLAKVAMLEGALDELCNQAGLEPGCPSGVQRRSRLRYASIWSHQTPEPCRQH